MGINRRTQHVFRINDATIIKQKVLNWLKQFGTFCFLDSCSFPHQEFELIAGAGVRRDFSCNDAHTFRSFQQFDVEKSWLLGHISYELGVRLNSSSELKPDRTAFPLLYFFEPEALITLKDGLLTITGENGAVFFDEINATPLEHHFEKPGLVEMKAGTTREEYIQIVEQLQQHIQRGDCYEINYCIDFFADKVQLDPVTIFTELTKLSPNPFSALYKLKDKWLICASPERFLKKAGNQLVSQPIKGTSIRLAQTSEELKVEQSALHNSQKDRAENVMVVDLVRNDLSRVCRPGSVTVDELFGVYSFSQVHQMISTISGRLEENSSFQSIIEATFPMGSMTGAPKASIMRLIDLYEKEARGIFSGTVGYVKPNGDFDLNVVIRSLMYDQQNGNLSYKVGSGITVYSNPESEWEECLLKAKAIETVLGSA